jgi:hypothetical protein
MHKFKKISHNSSCLPLKQQNSAVAPPAQVLNELEALEVQDEARGCCAYLNAPLRLLMAAT